MITFFNKRVAPLLFPSILWRTDEMAVHLTIDDGPHPIATPQVLKILRDERIHATFFLVGRNVEQYSGLARQIVEEGHSIGNHTYDHAAMLFKSKEFQRSQIRRTNMIIKYATGVSPSFFRPPYGYFDLDTLRVASTEGQKVVMWDVDTRDFSGAQHDSIARKASKLVRNGSVILSHDNEITAGPILEYLQPLVGHLVRRGFRFSALPL